MSREITYDTAADAEVIKGHPEEVSEAVIKSSEPCLLYTSPSPRD